MLSLVVPTVGRTDELGALLGALGRCEPAHKAAVEMIVVDQNAAGETARRVGEIIDAARADAEGHSLAIEHLRTPGESGASRARNTGLARARGQWVAFPDDDAVYPPALVAELLEQARRDHKLAIQDDPDQDNPDHAGIAAVTFRCEVEPGRPAADLRWDADPGPVTIENVWRRGALAHTFAVRTSTVRAIGGFDERLGPPICSGEDTELLMRLIGAGERIFYNPKLVSFHPENLDADDARGLGKAERYGYGLGRVYATHDRRRSARARILLAPAARTLTALLRGDRARARLERAILRGRRRGLREPLHPVWCAPGTGTGIDTGAGRGTQQK